jgi:chromosome transmission fidelity protein 1
VRGWHCVALTTAQNVRVVTLGSRRSTCIHSAVSALGSDAAINDACLDLVQSKRGSTDPSRKRARECGCPYMGESSQQHFSDKVLHALPERMRAARATHQLDSWQILAEVQDIEDIVEAGKRMGSCPYYATRRAVGLAQLVVSAAGSGLGLCSPKASRSCPTRA